MFVVAFAANALSRPATAGSTVPGSDKAESDLRASWKERRPDAGIVGLREMPPSFSSQGDWFEVTYLFELTVRQSAGQEIVRVGVNYLSKDSTHYVLSGISIEDAGKSPAQAAQNARPKKDELSKIILPKLNALRPWYKWDNLVPNEGQAVWNGKEFTISYKADVDRHDSAQLTLTCKNFDFDIHRNPLSATWFADLSFMDCPKSASDPTLVRGLFGVKRAAEPSPKSTTSAQPQFEKPELNAQICSDACQLLTRYAYDKLTADVCKICGKYESTFCEMDFPFNDVPSCEAYDEIRNCIYARFGYVFAKPKWQDLYAKMTWYKPDPGFTEAKLPPVAKANIQKLKDLKARRRGCQ